MVLRVFGVGTVATALLADTMTGAIASSVPVGILIFTFCQPRNNTDTPDVFDLF